ncbi:Zn(II)2Cys6 transcription factor [Aspergillus homomorphus CBS 101889]|uniref:Zn(II)2Cys6 transcription factor n=1 Tax=Aspergillus homomorphus (strain CBS 101889) TaxID=1450537 RepID=A0A395HNE2_ASPHC|nr:Zn(II)2Cys6 transcription factor [Aspergillus homomorphus CBS 101889]RAL09347.1 Zn(II)2Cys6 transcription factor [Aspergillus homomorphus CBS 101889]
MVYRGKPSAACAWCRSRRLKCNQKRPSCSSCLRAKRVCSGYRDLAALSFHDQTAEVVGKAHRRLQWQPECINSFSSRKQSNPVSPSDAECSADRRPAATALMLQSVSTPIADQGIAYVLTYHVGPADRSVSGHLSFLPSLLRQESSPAIMASINAMGLAALGNIHSSPQLIREARQNYTTALSKTNTALQDTATAKSDATLAAVLILGLYEIITCQSRALMVRWVDHIEGAMALIRLRGPEQLQRPVGFDLFMQLRGQYTLSNLYRKNPTPAWLVALSEETIGMRSPQLSSTEPFFKYLAQVSDLFAQIGRKAEKSPIAIVQEALQLDALLAAWALTIDQCWQYTVLDAAAGGKDQPAAQHVFGHFYHTYPEVGVAVIWNTYRMTRIVIHELIAAVCERLLRRSRGKNHEYWSTICRSAAITRQLSEEICASVPYYFGPNQPTASLIEASGLIRLHWTLFVASDCVGSTPRMKAWILQRLDEIGRRTGVQQALAMTEYLLGEVSLNWLKKELQALDNVQDAGHGCIPFAPGMLSNFYENEP